MSHCGSFPAAGRQSRTAADHALQGLHSWGENPQSASFGWRVENNSHVLALSEKRDAVGTWRIERPVRLPDLQSL
jgi:hypothetical protein